MQTEFSTLLQNLARSEIQYNKGYNADRIQHFTTKMSTIIGLRNVYTGRPAERLLAPPGPLSSFNEKCEHCKCGMTAFTNACHRSSKNMVELLIQKSIELNIDLHAQDT